MTCWKSYNSHFLWRSCHAKLALGFRVFTQWQQNYKHLSLPYSPTFCPISWWESQFCYEIFIFGMSGCSLLSRGWQSAWKAAVRVNSSALLYLPKYISCFGGLKNIQPLSGALCWACRARRLLSAWQFSSPVQHDSSITVFLNILWSHLWIKKWWNWPFLQKFWKA